LGPAGKPYTADRPQRNPVFRPAEWRSAAELGRTRRGVTRHVFARPGAAELGADPRPNAARPECDNHIGVRDDRGGGFRRPGTRFRSGLPELTEAERRLWEAFPYGPDGRVPVRGSRARRPGPAPASGTSRATIRAAVNRSARIGRAQAGAGGAPRGSGIVGARVVGQIELRHGRVGRGR